MRIQSFFGLQTQIQKTDKQLKRAFRELSEQKKLLAAGDDPVGTKRVVDLKAQLGSLKVANEKNIRDGEALLDTGKDAAEEIQSLLADLKELAQEAVTAGINDQTVNPATTAAFEAKLNELNELAHSTSFNDQTLFANGLDAHIQVGANRNEYVRVKLSSLTLSSLGLDDLDITNGDLAQVAVNAITAAETRVEAQISSIESQTKTLESRKTFNEKQMVNFEDLRSDIEDVDLEEAEARYESLQTLYESRMSLLRDSLNHQDEIFRLLLLNNRH